MPRSIEEVLADQAAQAKADRPILSKLASGAWDTSLGFLGGVGTVLDSLGRPVRTLSRDWSNIGGALQSIVDPSVEGSQAFEPFDESYGLAGKVGNFGVNVVTDPGSYVTFGATAAGGRLASAGSKAVAALTAGAKEVDVAADFLKATGVVFDKARHGAAGALPKLSQRFAAGEEAIGIGLPLGKMRLPLVTGPAVGKAAGVVEDVLGAGKSAFAAITPTPVLNFLRKAKTWGRESSGSAGADQVNTLARAAQAVLGEAQIAKTAAILDTVRDLGVKEHHMQFIEQGVQAMVPVAHSAKVAELTGQSVEEVTAAFGAHFKAKGQDLDAIYQRMIDAGLDQKQRDGMVAASEQMARQYDELLNIDKAVGREITEIGAATLTNLKDAREALVKDLSENWAFDAASFAKAGKPRDFIGALEGHALWKDIQADDVTRGLLDNFKLQQDIASTVPGYVFMRVGDDALPLLMDAARKDPTMMRRMSDYTGHLLTKEDANKAIQELGTAALAGEGIKSTLSLAELGQAFRRGFKGPGVKAEIEKARNAAGKMMETHPGLVMAHRIDSTARAVGAQAMARGLKAVVGDELPASVQALYTQKAALQKALRNADVVKRPVSQSALDPEKYMFHSSPTHNAPSIAEKGLFPGSWFARSASAAGAFSGDYWHSPRAFYAVPKDDLLHSAADADDIFGPLGIQSGEYVRSGRRHIPIEVTQEGVPVAEKLAIHSEADKIASQLAGVDSKLALELGPGGAIKRGQVLASSLADLHIKPGVDDFVLSSEVAEAVVRQHQALRAPSTYAQIMAPVRAANAFWKKTALFRPSTIARNAIGNKFLMLQNNLLDARSLLDEAGVYKLQIALSKNTPEGIDAAKAMMFDAGAFGLQGGKISGYDLVQEAKRLGVIDSSFWGHEFKGAAKEGLEAAVRGKSIAQRLNPLELSRRMAGAVENHDKLIGMLVRGRAGDTVEGAALAVNKALFNYNTVSPAVQFARSSGFAPFAAWSAKNIPLQLELLMRKPGQFMAMIHAKRAIEAGVPGVSDDELPKHLKNKFNVNLRMKDGVKSFVTLEGLIPIADLAHIASPEAMIEFVGQSIGPMPKEFIEQVTNRDAFTGKTISALDSQFGMFQVPYTKERFDLARVFGSKPVGDRVGHALRQFLPIVPDVLSHWSRIASGEIDPRTNKPYQVLGGALEKFFNPVRVQEVTPTDRRWRVGEMDRQIQNLRSQKHKALSRGGVNEARTYEESIRELLGRRAKLLGGGASRVP